MSDLTDFLLARIAEREAAAKVWRDNDAVVAMQADFDPDVYEREPWTIVLAECEAKRRIVAEHDFTFDAPVDAESSWDEFTVCRTCGGDVGDYPCATLRILATVYADHPDYQDAWRV